MDPILVANEVETSDTYREVYSRGRPVRGGGEQPRVRWKCVRLAHTGPRWQRLRAGICRFRECVGGSGGRDTSALAKTTVHSARYV